MPHRRVGMVHADTSDGQSIEGTCGMTNPVSQFTGSIPENYDRGLGQHLFTPYALDMARRVAALRPLSVLELAAGTGIVTRALYDVLPSTARLTATDLNPPMLDVARGKFGAQDAISFEMADATALPFGDDAFDCVVCQFGVMFFPDKDQSYREVRRVLKSGGAYVFNVWGRFAANPFADIANTTIGSFFEGDPPGFYKTPFGYYEIDAIEGALRDAGYTAIVFETIAVEQPIADARVFAEGLVPGNPVIEEIRSRGTAEPGAVIAAVGSALRRAFGEPGCMPLQAIVVSARKA